MKELLIRTFSGILYIVLILVTLFYNELLFTLVIFIFSAIALYEFQKLIDYKSPIPFLFLILLFVGFNANALNMLLINGLLFLALLANFSLIYWLFRSKKRSFNTFEKSFFSFFYMVSSCFFIIALLRLDLELGSKIIFFVFLMIWINDTFAYLTGGLIGKNQLKQTVSPNKTWEGFFGGAFFCLLTSVLIHQNSTIEFPLWSFIIVGLMIPFLATTGDLIQSKFKRAANVKDSGKLIPGHGGLYDRMDSIIFTAPFIHCFILILTYVS